MTIATTSGAPVDSRMRMLLPTTSRPWPPPEYNPITYQFRIWDAFWSGDPQKLQWTFYNLGANSPVGRAYFATTGEPGLPMPRPGQFRGGLLGSVAYLHLLGRPDSAWREAHEAARPDRRRHRLVQR